MFRHGGGARHPYRYQALTKPPSALAEGRQWLEEIGGGRTRVRFYERHEITNPLFRALIEHPLRKT